MTESVTFLASIAALQSGIQISGDGNGMRVKIDVPETEMGNALELLAWREKVLRVTIEPVINKVNHGNPGSQVEGGRSVSESEGAASEGARPHRNTRTRWEQNT